MDSKNIIEEDKVAGNETVEQDKIGVEFTDKIHVLSSENDALDDQNGANETIYNQIDDSVQAETNGENDTFKDESEQPQEVIDDGDEDQYSVIPLSDVIVKCMDYLEQRISDKEFQQWAGQIKMRPYIPIVEKVLIVDEFLYSDLPSEDNDSPSWIIGEYEQKKLWYILLQYTNIDIADSEDLMNSASYDIIMQSIGAYLMLFVKDDYERIVSMIDDSLNYLRIHEILSVFEKFDTENLNKYGDDVKAQLDYLSKNKDTLEYLSNIVTKFH